MGEIKVTKTGEFIYRYLGEGKVAIAYRNIISHLTGPMVVYCKMKDLANYSDRIFDLKYDGVNYVACIFDGILEDELIKVLS